MNLEETIIHVYLRVEEKYRSITGGCRIRAHGFNPGLTDAEIITMEIVGEMQGRHDDTAIWRYFRDHWQEWFPRLGSYKNFTRHAANLVWMKQKIMAELFPADAGVHIIDGVAMPVCHNARARRCKSFTHDAAWGYCAAKDEYYYGLRGHPVINLKAQVVAFPVSSANADERDALFDIINKISGILLGDKGFISREWKEKMRLHGVDLQTPLRDNMVETRSENEVKTILRVRRLVETVIGILTEKFSIASIKARDLWRFSSRVYRKILAYNFYIEVRGS
jgi:hypothetical protein